MKKMKKCVAWLLTAGMLLSTLSAMAATPNFSDITNAQDVDDIATVEKLLRQEKSVDLANKGEYTFTIDDDATRLVNWDALGVQCELPDVYGYYQNPGSTETKEGFIKIVDEINDAPVARWGGGHSDGLNLMHNIGPLEERKPSYDLRVPGDGAIPIGYEWGFQRKAPSTMGPVEFIKSMQAINPDIKFIICLPIFTQTPEQSGQFIRFLLDDKNESEWGALRASYGIEEPVNLLGFELGNENYFQADTEVYCSNHASMSDQEKIDFAVSQAEVYTRFAANHMNAITAFYPDIKFYANTSGGYADRIYADPWTQTIARDLHDKIDGIAFHAYYGHDWPYFEDQLNHIQSTYKGVTGVNTKFVFTEHAQWGSGDTINRRSLFAALPEASFFNLMQSRDDIVCANYHNLTGEHWALFQELDGRYYSTGVNEVHRLYREKLGDTLLPIAEDDGFRQYFSGIATKRDNGQVVIAITNRQEKEVKVNLNFENKAYRLVHETVYTAPNQYTVVYNENTKDIFTIQERAVAVDNISQYTVRDYSLTILTLEEMGSAKVMDLEPTVARNEMKQAKISEDFENYLPQTLNVNDSGMVDLATGEAAELQVAGNWSLFKTGALLGTNPTANIADVDGNKKMAMTGITAAVNLYPFRQAYLAYTGSRAGIHESEKISFDFQKESVYNGFGLRFLMDETAENYYTLWFTGNKECSSNSSPLWALYKNGAIVAQSSETMAGVAEGAGGIKSGSVEVKINGKEISWSIDGTRHDQSRYRGEGSFTDEQILGVPQNTREGFFATHTAITYIDNFSIEPLPAYEKSVEKNMEDLMAGDAFVSGGEPDNVLYVKKEGEKLSPFVDSQFDTLTVDAMALKGDDSEYTLSAEDTATKQIGNTDFYLQAPYAGVPVGGPVKVSNLQEGGIALSAGIDQPFLNLNERKCVLIWQPEEFYELSNNYKLTVNANASNSHPGFGIRFHIRQDGKSYYMLGIHSPQDNPGEPLWSLYKFVDGENLGAVLSSKAVPEVSTENYLRGDYQVELTVRDDASVEVTVTGREGTFKETQTFQDTSDRALNYNAKAAGYIGFVKNGRDTITIKNIQLANLIYKDESDRYNFTTGAVLRKIVNNSDEKTTIWVCNDDYAYKKLAEIPAGGKFINDLTAQVYQYVKVEGGKDVEFYTALTDEGALRPTQDMPRVYARIQGKDVDNATLTSKDTTILYTGDQYLIPVSCGTATLIASDGESAMEIPVQVSGYAGFYEDFESYGNTETVDTPWTYYGGYETVAGDWVLCQNHSYVVNNKPKAAMVDGAFGLSGSVLDIFDTRIAYARYNKGFAGIDNQYTLSFTGTKSSTTMGMALRFHMHDDDKSFYQLHFGGIADNEKYVWRFDKIEEGIRVDSATVYGPTFQSYNTNGNGPMHGKFYVTVTVDRGEISWTIEGKRYNNRTYKVEGSYSDPDFTEVSGEDMRIGFQVNTNGGNVGNFCYFDDVKLSGKTVEGTKTEENAYGKYILMDKKGRENAIFFRADYETENPETLGMLKDLECYGESNWSSQEFISLFIPKDMADLRPYQIWDFKTLKPLGELAVTEETKTE